MGPAPSSAYAIGLPHADHTVIDASSSKRPLIWFLFWLIALSAPVCALSVAIGSEPPMLSRMLMWCPGTAALLTCLICRLDLRSLGWTWPRGRFVGWSYVLPWLYAVPVYLAAWAFIPGAFQWEHFSTPLAATFKITSHPDAFAAFFGIPTTMVFIVIGTLAWTLGEELGWRGFLVPRLYERWGYAGTSLAVGLLWAVWHYPVLLGADYNAGTPAPYAIACFTVMVVGLSFVMTWLRMASGSLWPCVILHAVHNTLVQGVLDASTATDGRAPYVTTEFGFGMAVTLGVCVVVLAMKHRKTVAALP